MTAQASLLELNLDTEARLVAGAHAASEVFRILQQAAVKCAARSAVFLIRKGRIRGWSCTGYTEEILGAQRTFDRPLEASFLERFDSSGQTRGSAIDFGQPSCAESFGCVVQLRGQPIAMLLLERPGNDTPWEPAALNVLVTVAQLRLELDLVQRKLETLSGATAPSPAATVSTPPPAAVEPAPTESTVSVDLAATPEPTNDERPEIEAARRYARLVATDIRLYNEEAVMLGRRNGDLPQRLGEQLGRGKETFLRRHGALGPAGLGLLHEAYVQVLAGGDAKLIPEIVP